ncbi:MAG: glycosyltransferase [Bacteroidia bacterium]|nr:glycosyltransferase [Bacteroidia bacterium]
MISVIICTYNRAKYIYGVLESLAKNDFPCDRYEIVLVDNNCTDNTAAEVSRFKEAWPEVKLRCCKETDQGLSYARNRGIKEASGDVLVYVDDDAFVNGKYLSNYAELFARRPDIQAAGGPIIPHYETGSEPSWMTYHLKRLLTGYLFFGDEEKDFPGDNYPGGGNAAYRASVFDEVGLYNVELGRKGGNLGGGEEKDIFNKMESAGMKFVYTPGSILYHSIPGYKLEEDYFTRVTCGIGDSERIRTLAVSKAEYMKRLFKEAVKWAGTLVLSLGYLLKGKAQCGGKLIRFRWNVTRRLLATGK